MTGLEPLAYIVVRVLTCGIWMSGGIEKVLHFADTAKEMTRRGIPFSRPVLVLVIAMEYVGVALILSNLYVWATCLVWGAFLIPATIIYHAKFITPEGKLDVMQYRAFFKNVSILGGLIALLLLDPARPAWLLG